MLLSQHISASSRQGWDARSDPCSLSLCQDLFMKQTEVILRGGVGVREVVLEGMPPTDPS